MQRLNTSLFHGERSSIHLTPAWRSLGLNERMIGRVIQGKCLSLPARVRPIQSNKHRLLILPSTRLSNPIGTLSPGSIHWPRVTHLPNTRSPLRLNPSPRPLHRVQHASSYSNRFHRTWPLARQRNNQSFRPTPRIDRRSISFWEILAATGIGGKELLLGLVAGSVVVGGAALTAKYLGFWWRSPPKRYTPKGEDPLYLLMPDYKEQGISWDSWSERLTDRKQRSDAHKEAVVYLKECRRNLRWASDATDMPTALRGLAWVLTIKKGDALGSQRGESLHREALDQLIECLQCRTHWGKSDFPSLCEVEGLLANFLIHEDPHSPIEGLAAKAYYLVIQSICFALDGTIDGDTINDDIIAIRERAGHLEYKVARGHYECSPAAQYDLLSANQLIRQGTTLGAKAQINKVLSVVQGTGGQAGVRVFSVLTRDSFTTDVSGLIEDLKEVPDLICQTQAQLNTVVVDWNEQFETLGKLRLYLRLVQPDDEQTITVLLHEIRTLIPGDPNHKPIEFTFDPKRHLSTSLPSWVTAYGVVDLLCEIASNPRITLSNRQQACRYLKRIVSHTELSSINWRVNRIRGDLPLHQSELIEVLDKKTSTFDDLIKKAKNAPIDSLDKIWRELCPINVTLFEMDYLVGRHKELLKLDRLLFEGSKRLAILEGHGGMGKSAMTEMFIDRHIQDYDQVMVLNAETDTTLTRDLERILGSPELESSTSNPKQSRLDRLLDYVGTQLSSVSEQNGRLLIVVQNIDPSFAHLSVKSLTAIKGLASIGLTSVIMHSQNKNLHSQLGIDRRPCIELHHLDSDDATSLFLTIHSNYAKSRGQGIIQFTSEDARKVVEHVSGIPLVVVQTAIYIASTSKKDYKHFSQTQLAGYYADQQAADPFYHKKMITKALDVTLDLLQQDRRAFIALIALAFCDPDEIEESWLNAIFTYLDRELQITPNGNQIKATLALSKTDKEIEELLRQDQLPLNKHLTSAQDTLYDHFLIRRDDLLGRVSISRVVQEQVLNKLQNDEHDIFILTIFCQSLIEPNYQFKHKVETDDQIFHFILADKCYKMSAMARCFWIISRFGVDNQSQATHFRSVHDWLLQARTFAEYLLSESLTDRETCFTNLERMTNQIFEIELEGDLQKFVQEWSTILCALEYFFCQHRSNLFELLYNVWFACTEISGKIADERDKGIVGRVYPTRVKQMYDDPAYQALHSTEFRVARDYLAHRMDGGVEYHRVASAVASTQDLRSEFRAQYLKAGQGSAMQNDDQPDE